MAQLFWHFHLRQWKQIHQEIRRRTRVARLFPNDASCLRLVSAIVMEIAEDWQTANKRYLTFSD
jgi:transposase-like protein